MTFDWYMWLAQGLGFIALGLGVYAYLIENDTKTRILMSLQSFILCVHFLMMGALSAGFIFFIIGIRNYLSLKQKAKKIWPVFMLLFTVLGIWNYKAWQDILPVISSYATTYGYFNLSGVPLRLSMLFSAALWVIHNSVIGSVGPAILEFLLCVSCVITIIRLKRSKKAETKPVLPPIA